MDYIEIFLNAYKNYFNYLVSEITSFHWGNYFYGLLIVSLLIWILEIYFPWRKNQKIFRKDFWLDIFYLFFNFFLLNLIFLVALSDVTAALFENILSKVGWSLPQLTLIDASSLQFPLGLLLFFVVTDFVQWLTHRMLHKFEFLWEYHKVHHSVKEMGFAAHFRYHWMEPIIYKSMLYLPIAIVGGFSLDQVFIVHMIAISIGHLNHANVNIDYGFLKYIFNNPKMHIWHHSKELPNTYGVNFGISLSLWDYLFKTDYIPHDGRDIPLGFDGDENYQGFYLLNKKP